MARDLLVKVCSHRGHLLLDKYKSPSIKDVDRKLVATVFRMHSPYQAPTKPSDRVERSASKTGHSRKSLPVSS